MARKDETITVLISAELYDDLKPYFENGTWFSSLPELAGYAIHSYLESILVRTSFYEGLVNGVKGNPNNIAIIGGSTLGAICRMLDINTDVPDKNDPATHQFSLRVTENFGKMIDDLIESTGFFKSRADYCRNALIDFVKKSNEVNKLSRFIGDKSVLFVTRRNSVHSIFISPLRGLHNLHVGVVKPIRADTKDWLDRDKLLEVVDKIEKDGFEWDVV